MFYIWVCVVDFENPIIISSADFLLDTYLFFAYIYIYI